MGLLVVETEIHFLNIYELFPFITRDLYKDEIYEDGKRLGVEKALVSMDININVSKRYQAI